MFNPDTERSSVWFWTQILSCSLPKSQRNSTLKHTRTQNMNSPSNCVVFFVVLFFNYSLTNTRQSWQSWPGRGWGLRGQERLGILSTLSSGVLQTAALPALHSQVPKEISLLNHHKGAVRDNVIWTSINTKNTQRCGSRVSRIRLVPALEENNYSKLCWIWEIDMIYI